MIVLFVIALLIGVVGLLMAVFGPRAQNEGDTPFKSIGGSMLFIGFLFFLISAVTCVPAGHTGVQNEFGEVRPNTLSEGIHLRAPWLSVHNMSLQQQRQSCVLNASTNTGVTIDVGLTVVYRLDPAFAANIYQTVGEDYYDVLIAPYIFRTVKNIFVSYPPEAIYTIERATVNMIIEDSLRTLLAPRGIIIEQVPIDNIDLPITLRDAIVAKQEAEQQALQMQYVLQRQEQESERMRIEARGIADYQDIVSSNLTPELLQWRAIEVTRSLAESENTTFVIVGNTDTGLPMILQP